MIASYVTTNKMAMLMLKAGKFIGHLVEFSTDYYGITTVIEHIKEKGEK